jgi:DNA-binding transcriptional ArsR family regulator
MIAAATPGQAAVIDHARKEPHAFLEQVVSDLRCYWAAALEPFWPRLHSLAEADIAWRLERIAAYGARAALADLHPRVELRGSELVVHTTCAAEPAPPGQGMVLVPCAFAWPEILLLDGPTAPPTLGYASRGIGSLWHQPDRPGAELGDLIGRTRATLLHLLDLPATTTQLAAYLQLTAAATNSHLQILHRAGAVTRRRRGRSVFYDRTGLGDALLAGTPQPPT